MRLESAYGLGSHTRRLLISALAVALLLTLGAFSASAATSATCTVTNTDTGRTFPRLQQAVDVAKPGARLVVKGTCVGKTFIGKRLVIEGVRTHRFGRPKLSGAGTTRVLHIGERAQVKLWGVEILRGRSYSIYGAGIFNAGKLVLRDVVVHGNTLCYGGFAVTNSGFLSMRGSSSVSHNRCERFSDYERAGRGGIANGGRFVMYDASSIEGNAEGGLVNNGTVTMNGTSSIRGNRAVESVAAGVYNHEHSVLTMNDASTISDNVTDFAGGVSNYGTFTMNDMSSIRGNRATLGSVGGVASLGTFTMTGASSIVGNTAVVSPGGLSNGRSPGPIGSLVGVTCGPGGNVYGNTPDDCHIEP